MVRMLPLIALAVPLTLWGQAPGCSTLPDSTRIQPVGAFSNMRFTEEHAYSYLLRARGPKW
jgi:hypothetical protein